jgi:hypothetical protein
MAMHVGLIASILLIGGSNSTFSGDPMVNIRSAATTIPLPSSQVAEMQIVMVSFPIVNVLTRNSDYASN